MKIVKMNVGIRQGKRAKYRTSLFLCPVCGKTVERITASGIRSKACSVRCTSKMGGNKFHANICAECAVDNCRWLLKAKPVKG